MGGQQQMWLPASLAGTCVALAATAYAGEPYPYTDEWWALRAQDPPGTRQVEKDGKLWPPYARPVGKPQHWVHKYHHAHYWPHPYNCEDQAFVRNILDLQTSGGWMSATTLRGYHFDSESNELNTNGRQHLGWILQAAPVQYRTVYVAQDISSDVNAVRQAAVQRTVQELLPSSSIPVIIRQDDFYGRPAQEIDQLRRLELQSMPRPRLFVVGATGGGSGGGGGSSAQAGGTSGAPTSGGSTGR